MIPRIKLACAACVIFLCTSFANAQDVLDLSGLQLDPTLPIEIVSESLEVVEPENLAIFRGSAVATQGELELGAEELWVKYRVVEGETGGRAIELIRAIGGMRMTNGQETVRGQEGEYNLRTHQLVVSGGASIFRGENVIHAETITANLVTGQAVVSGDADTQVRASFLPAPLDNQE